jgi:predicted DNA-binding protein with PD1-like motif
MTTPSDNNTVRITPEQKLIKSVNELVQQYLLTGGSLEFSLGMLETLKIFWTGPAVNNARRQAEAMMQAQADAQNPRQ